jgi:DNA transposition AAA+ family ATPase
MVETTKIVKGGFRATLALIISIIALAVSIGTYASSTKERQLNDRIQTLRGTMEKMKAESAEQLNKLRNETAGALEKMSEALKQAQGPKSQ